LKSPLRVFMGLLLGALLGYVCRRSSFPLLHHVPALVEPLARLFINAIRVCVLPLVTTSLIAGCASTNSAKLGRLAGKSLILILLYLTAAAVFAGSIAFPLFRYLSHVLGRGSLATSTFSIPSAAAPTFASFLGGLIPANIFKAAEDGALLPLVLFSVALGIAISHLPDAERVPLTRFFRSLADSFTILIGGILKTAPLGVFCLAVGLAASVGVGGAGFLVSYVVAMCFLSGAFILVILYPSIGIFSSLSLSAFIRASAPAQAIAFTSRSSLAALPASYKAASESLYLPEDVSAFFFPFAASIFHVGGCIEQMVGVCALAGFYGVSLSSAQFAVLILNAIVVSMTAPGIPGGAIIVMAPMLASAGIPLDGMAMLLAVDTLPDMFRTTATVSCWVGAASLLNPRAQSIAIEVAPGLIHSHEPISDVREPDC
jgi:proton glutamate symport protein